MLIAFVPVLHQGYLELFKKYSGQTLGILSADVISDFTSLTRDLRVIDPQEMREAIFGLELFDQVRVLERADLESLDGQSLVMPDEDVSQALYEKYFPNAEVIFEPVFLRWDMPAALSQHAISPDRVISTEARDREFIAAANKEAQSSVDFWRQIGAVVVKDGAIVSQKHNHHLPTDYHLMQNGDPRSNFDAGTHQDIYTSIHSETSAIADCAKRGIALDGCSIYVTTFPCSNCARLIAESGIKKVYYEKGYSRLDAEDIFKAFGVEIVLVQ